MRHPGNVFTVAWQSQHRKPWHTVTSYVRKPDEPSWEALRRWGHGMPGTYSVGLVGSKQHAFGLEICPECGLKRFEHDEWDFRFCPSPTGPRG